MKRNIFDEKKKTIKPGCFDIQSTLTPSTSSVPVSSPIAVPEKKRQFVRKTEHILGTPAKAVVKTVPLISYSMLENDYKDVDEGNPVSINIVVEKNVGDCFVASATSTTQKPGNYLVNYWLEISKVADSAGKPLDNILLKSAFRLDKKVIESSAFIGSGRVSGSFLATITDTKQVLDLCGTISPGTRVRFTANCYVLITKLCGGL